MECSVKDSAHALGKKWSIEVIEEMALGDFGGFSSFLRKTRGLTQRGLSQRLKELEESGTIKKEVSVTGRKRATSYSLTKKGREMHNLVLEIKKWNIKWNKTPDFCLHTPCSECKASK